MMQTALADSLDDLNNIVTTDDFERVLDRCCKSIGFNSYSYFAVNAEIVPQKRCEDYIDDIFLVTNQRADWVQHYIEEDYPTTDPVLMDSFRGRSPIIWNENYRREARTNGEEQMMFDAYDHGLKRGISIPVHGPGGEFGMLVLDSDMKEIEFKKLIAANQNQLELIANHAHAAVTTKFSLSKIPKPTPLSEREVEVLRWTANGKTAWEIASILNISERTVHFHLQKMMRKLGALNKTHATAKAMSHGVFFL